MTLIDERRVDMEALRMLIEAHPDEFRKLRENADLHLLDKYGRSVAVKDNIITPAGEKGMVIRIDKNSKRVLVRLDDTGKTRMLMAHRVEVRRGRPRKDS